MALLYLIIYILTFYYILLKRPGISLSFVFFFQSIPVIVFDNLNLIELRYSVTILFLLSYLIVYLKPHKISKHILRILQEPFFIGVILLFIIMTSHVLLNGGLTDDGISTYIGFLVPNLVLTLIAVVAVYSINHYKEIIIGIIVGSLFLIIAMYTLSDIDSISTYDRMAVSDTLQINPIWLARTFGVIIIAALLIILNKLGYALKLLCTGLILLSIYWMLLTASRGAILSCLFVICLYLLSNINNKKFAIMVGIGFLVIMPFVYYLLYYVEFLVVDRFEELHNYEQILRFEGYLLAIDIFMDNLLFGTGPSGYYKLTGRIYPHNLFLEMISEYGILGLISYILLFITTAYSTFKNIFNKNIEYQLKFIYLIWWFYFLNSMFSGDIVSNRELWIVSGLICGIKLSNIYEVNNNLKYNKYDYAKSVVLK